MIVAPGLLYPTAVSNSDAASLQSSTNMFGVDEAHCSVQARREAISEAQQVHLDEVALALSVLGEQSLFINPAGQCQLTPDVPHRESILTTGVQDAVMEQMEANLADEIRAADALRQRFQDKMPLFATWKRIHQLIPRAAQSAFADASSVALMKPRNSSGCMNESTAPPSPTGESDSGGEFDAPAIRGKAVLDQAASGTIVTPTDSAQFRKSIGGSTTSLITRPTALPLHVQFQPYAPNFGRGRLLDDAYFVTAVAAVATNRKLFSDLFVSLEHLHRGAATFQFYRGSHHSGHEAEFVTVDTLVPVTGQTRPHSAPKDMKLVFGRVAETQDAWLVLLEKAYATFRGSYAALDGGCAVDALTHLTGGTTRVVPVGCGSLDEAWWQIAQGTLHGDLMVAYRSPSGGHSSPPPTIPTIGVDWENDSVVVVCGCEYDTTVEIPQDLYAKLLGKAPERGEVVRLVKVRRCFRKLRSEEADESFSWEWSSSKWTTFARKHLGRDADHEGDPETEADSLTWWMTVQEFSSRYQHLALCANFPNGDVCEHVHALTPAPSVHDVALHVPIFGVSVVAKVNPGEIRRKASRRQPVAVPQHEFQTIRDVQIPILDLGADETEDEEESEGSRSGTPTSIGATSPRSGMSGSMTFLDSMRSRKAVSLEIRVSVPPSQYGKQFQLVLYRAPGKGKKIATTATYRDGNTVHQLPAHGRVSWSRQAAPVELPDFSIPMPSVNYSRMQADGLYSLAYASYFGEVELNEGHYNIAVVPDVAKANACDTTQLSGPVMLSVRQRHRAPITGGASAPGFDLFVDAIS